MGVVQYITENPQVCAAFITSIAGIAGIFINIGVNIHYRHKDYENKNKARLIENLDTYYLPLLDRLTRIRKLAEKAETFCDDDLRNLAGDKAPSYNAAVAKQFRDSIVELNNSLTSENSRFQDDYELFKALRSVKQKVELLQGYFMDNKKYDADYSLQSFSADVDMLIYRIQCNEVSCMEKCLVSKLRLRWSLYQEYRKK